MKLNLKKLWGEAGAKAKCSICEERDAFGLSTGQSVFQKQPDQTESQAKPNTPGLQSGTETQSCSPAGITLHTVSTSAQHTLQSTVSQRFSTFFELWPLQMKKSPPVVTS